MVQANKANQSEKSDPKLPEEIITFAREHGIDTESDQNLSKILSSLKSDKKLPEEILTLLSELILYIYKLRGSGKHNYGNHKK